MNGIDLLAALTLVLSIVVSSYPSVLKLVPLYTTTTYICHFIAIHLGLQSTRK